MVYQLLKKSDYLKEEEKKRKLNICSTVCIRLMTSQGHGTGHILFQVIFTYTRCFSYWTSLNLAKSQTLYKIPYSNFSYSFSSDFYIYMVFFYLAKFSGTSKKHPVEPSAS